MTRWIVYFCLYFGLPPAMMLVQPPILRVPVVQMPLVEEVLQVRAGPTLKLPAEVKTVRGFVVIRPLEYDGDDLKWKVLDPGLSLTPPELHPDPGVFVAVALTDGRYRVMAIAVKMVDGKAKASEFESCVIIVGDPGPLPPIPPDPPIPPKPPDPPVPPIPVAGFRVLFVYESATPGNTASIVANKDVKAYLDAKTAKGGADGKSPEWRVLDKDQNMTNAAKHWQDAMQRPRTSLPWIIVSSSTGSFEGPLPSTADAVLTLLKKFGG